MYNHKEETYLGLDLSTQKLKAILLNNDLKVLQTQEVHFDSDLPEFRTHGGVIRNVENPKEILAPTLMWVKALDMLLDKLLSTGVDFATVAAISGTAQQHGSVYWNIGANDLLQHLNPDKFMYEQLSEAFSISNSPVWMDSSTTEQCRLLERDLGGYENLARITGSRAYERFTASQIKKIWREKSEQYEKTERISLISSFLCSLFLGKVSPIDYADGAGMNLLDIRNKIWSIPCLEACAPDLLAKLRDPVDSKTVVGNISKYLVDRFGFSEQCKIVAFTGDNPASLAGMCLENDWIAVSLGTSDTLFLWLDKPVVFTQGHLLCNPVDKDAFMALLCFKNGSLTREKIRDISADGSWEIFNALLDMTPRGNFGNFALYFHTPEIIPPLVGEHRYNIAEIKTNRFASHEVEIRAIIEGQCISRKAHAEDMGFKFGPTTKILATGGASSNKSILQVFADVFNASVYVQDTADSAMLGAAYQAKHGLYNFREPGKHKFCDIVKDVAKPTLLCEPYPDSQQIYDPMMNRYRKIITELLAEQKNK